MSIKSEISVQIIDIANRLYAKNILAAADGNISFRISNSEILMTPSGMAKAFIKPKDIAVIDIDGNVISGNPSGERLMHLEIYRKCPEAKAIVHAHPPTAIAWTISNPELMELPYESMPEVILATGRIPVVPYARPGTVEMGTNIHPFLPDSKALILARHGAVCWGFDLEEAWRGMERIEHSSQILCYAKQLGGIHKIPQSEVDALFKIRKQIGNRLL